MGQNKKLKPFGEIPESFEGLIDRGIYYTDKTGFIPYLIEQERNICVFTRPRRFGKTLMLRTLETFFEYRLDDDGKPIDNRRYFEGLKVMDAGENVLKEMGQYPVISLSFKEVSGDRYDEVIDQLRGAVCEACNPHEKILKESGILSEEQLKILQSYLDGNASDGNLRLFLKYLPLWLFKATCKKVVILLDEYDVPLQQAAIYDNRHPGSELFDKTVRLVGNFISSGFKSNSNLAYGIIAGCMRVAKESIFTGMNNPGVITVVDEIPDEYWGFTQKEVEKMLDYYGLSDKMDALKHWYEGYFYSGRDVYNPWSLLNAIRGLVNGYEYAIQSYWSMTSSNDIIDDMIDHNPQYRTDLAELMNGGTKWIPIYKDLSYRDLKLRPDAIWSFLLYTGYLKPVEIKKDKDDLWIANVAVPNREILTVMKSAMRHWWKDIQIHGYNTKPLVNALVAGDAETIEREFRLVLKSSTSVFDYNEAFYHGMTVGLLQTVAEVHSNDEYGEGRPDVVTAIGDKGIILELKCVTPKALEHAGIKDNDRAKIKAMMVSKLDEAAKQIHDNEYIEAVLDDEPAARSVLAYAVCFCKKRCMVRRVE